MGILRKTQISKSTPKKHRAKPNTKNNKNSSKKIENGRTLKTRDEFLEGGKGKLIHPEHPNPNDLYRKIIVVDSNIKDELAVVKAGTSKGESLNNYQKGKSKYQPYILTLDENGNPIIVDNKRFKLNSRNENVSKKDVVKIKTDCLTNSKTSKSLKKENRKKLRKLKDRK